MLLYLNYYVTITNYLGVYDQATAVLQQQKRLYNEITRSKQITQVLKIKLTYPAEYPADLLS